MRRFTGVGNALLMMLSATAVSAQTADDSAGVRAAVLDYVNAIYHTDTTLIYRSVRPDLAKRGYYIRRFGSSTS